MPNINENINRSQILLAIIWVYDYVHYIPFLWNNQKVLSDTSSGEWQKCRICLEGLYHCNTILQSRVLMLIYCRHPPAHHNIIFSYKRISSCGAEGNDVLSHSPLQSLSAITSSRFIFLNLAKAISLQTKRPNIEDYCFAVKNSSLSTFSTGLLWWKSCREAGTNLFICSTISWLHHIQTIQFKSL